MGDFSNKVRNGNIKGPTNKSFSLEDWLSSAHVTIANFDSNDFRVFEAGLVLDQILKNIRSAIKVDDIKIPTIDKVKLAIGLSNFNLMSIDAKSPFQNEELKKNTFSTVQIQQFKIDTILGQEFSPDELITSMGDGLKYIIRQFLQTNEPKDVAFVLLNNEHLNAVMTEVNLAILYHTACDFWGNVVGNDYETQQHSDRVIIKSNNPEMEKSRIASIYRRRKNMIDEAVIEAQQLYIFEKKGLIKNLTIKVPRISNILYEGNKVSHVEISFGLEELIEAGLHFSCERAVVKSYLNDVVNQKFPKFENLTIRKIIDAWKLIQLLSAQLFSDLEKHKKYHANEVMDLCSIISKDTFIKLLMDGVSVSEDDANKILKVLTYTGTQDQDLWTQPIVPIGIDFTLCLSTIHSACVQRIIESWLRQGGYKLQDKGGVFETKFRENILKIINESRSSEFIKTLLKAIKLHPKGERKEEVDAVLVVGNTVLLMELKCILWPEDSIQFANYRRTIEDATTQVTRKLNCAKRNPDVLVNLLRRERIIINSAPNIIACVVVNNAAYVGFPINGTPVVDTNILRSFIENQFIVSHLESNDGGVKSRKMRFYTQAEEAQAALESYLMNPPQLNIMKQNIVSREIILPFQYREKFVTHETFDVNIDTSALGF